MHLKKDKKKTVKLLIDVDLKKHKDYSFVPSLSNVFFPYPPYPEQLVIIKTIQQSIQNKEHSLIQSPTGTGKTLCLLVGALSGLMNDEGSRNKIFYLTRTHSQITQVISEFMKTVYDCKINIIASRQQLCINHNLTGLKGKMMEKACSDLCVQKLCAYRQFGNKKGPSAMNLNDFKEYCKKDLICPYFFSKQLVQRSQITIMPFNYLLDWSQMQKNQFDLKDSVIIFDEAHNIDTLSEQGSSIDLSNQLLALSLNDLRNLMKVTKKRYLHEQFANQRNQNTEIQEIRLQIETFSANLKTHTEEKYYNRHSFLEEIERMTTAKKLHLEVEGLDLGNYLEFCGKGKKIIKEFFKKEVSSENFINLLTLIEKIFSLASSQKHFNLFSSAIVLDGNQKIIRLRCLDPSISFNRIFDQKPRSVILSSGTLGPLDVWQKSIGHKFANKINFASFIGQNQLYSQVISRGSNNIVFDFSFQKKHNQKQYEELAKILKNLENLINNGIVIAFSNYQLMQKTIKQCKLLRKKVFYQSKTANIDEIYKDYSSAAKSEGAFLFIIVRGRFSEGINFNDELCRCLIVVGIPYLPLKDANVVEKMRFIESNESKGDAEKWYTRQTFKGLNQTIGRVIRNKNDYGVILLLDHRYQKEDVISEFSDWFQKGLRKSTNNFYEGIQNFLKEQSWLKQRQVNHSEEGNRVNTITKNKHEASILERLQQFSTPSKTNRKILKVISEDDSQDKEKDMKKRTLRERPMQKIEDKIFKKMNDDLAQYFYKGASTEQISEYNEINPDNSDNELVKKGLEQCKMMRINKRLKKISLDELLLDF